jgi:hypothetical protein
MNLRILIVGLLPLTAMAQRVTFGIQGGIQTQTPVSQTSAVPFAAGATVGLHIISGLSLESGVLYTRLGSGNRQGTFLYPENSVTTTFESWHARAVEVPFLAKYRFRGEEARWRPFVTAGPTVRHTSLNSQFFTSVLSGTPLNGNFGNVLKTETFGWNVDPAAGLGVDFRAGRFHLEPEARYSYWGAGTDNGRIRKNQVTLMLGFRF